MFLSGLVYLSQSASIDIAVQEVDPEKLRQRGLSELIGAQNIFWSADQAIVSAEALGCRYCEPP